MEQDGPFMLNLYLKAQGVSNECDMINLIFWKDYSDSHTEDGLWWAQMRSSQEAIIRQNEDSGYRKTGGKILRL